MIKKNHVESSLPEYLDGLLDGEERRIVETHLATCRRCRTTAEELRKTLGTIDGLKASMPSTSYWQNFLPRLHQRLSDRDTTGATNPGLRPVLSVQRFVIPALALLASVFVLMHIQIVPPNRATDPELRQLVGQMDLEELNRVSVVTRHSLVPDPVNSSELLLTTEGATRPVVDSLLALRSAEFLRLTGSSLLGISETGLESLTEEELTTVLARLERTALL